MHIFFSVGEASGDQHAARLICELKRLQPAAIFSGLGGPLMERAGCRLLYRMTDLAVMGIRAVLPLLWKFYRLWRMARQFLEQSRPDAVVLIDFPGFNWWIARAAKAAGIPVFYYFPPQLWAWAPWRVRKMRRFVDHVLCCLPFEPGWYAQHGVAAQYVGHPIFDEVAEYPLDEEFRADWATGKSIALLPGSRDAEVKANWPIMLDVVRRLQRRAPTARFLVACYKESQRQWCLEQLFEEDKRLAVHFFVGRTADIIHLADCCLMVSGSVSLEVLARAKPALVIYRMTRLVWGFVQLIVRVQFLSLPNIIANRAVMPEFYCAWNPDHDVEQMTELLQGWLTDPRKLDEATAAMREVRDTVRQFGAAAQAAEAVLRTLSAPVRKVA